MHVGGIVCSKTHQGIFPWPSLDGSQLSLDVWIQSPDEHLRHRQTQTLSLIYPVPESDKLCFVANDDETVSSRPDASKSLPY